MTEATARQVENFAEFMEILKQKSASVSFDGEAGKLITYTGRDKESGKLNRDIARDCADKVPNSYTIHDTDAGKYLDKEITKLKINGVITDAQYRQLWDKASDMVVRQAEGPILAVTEGAVKLDSTFMRVEVPPILKGETNVHSINGIDSSLLNIGDIKNPATAQNFLDMVGTSDECKDPPNAGAGGMLAATSAYNQSAKVSAGDAVITNDQMWQAAKTYIQLMAPTIPRISPPSAEERELEGGNLKTSPLLAPSILRMSPLVKNQLVPENNDLAQKLTLITDNMQNSGVNLRLDNGEAVSPVVRGEVVDRIASIA